MTPRPPSPISIGTSGWMYKHWGEVFYPKDIKGIAQLPYLAHEFDTVEINSSFYRIPRESAAEGWYKATPASFRFAVKLNSYITHAKKLILDGKSRQRLEWFHDALKPLGKKYDVLLVQLQPSFAANFERLETFMNALPPYVDYPHRPDICYEFRHASWFTPRLYELMRERQAGLVIATYPGKFKPPYEITSDIIYIRFHATAEHPDYSPRELDKWAAYIRDLKARQIYVYFNNDFEGWAIENARYLKKVLGL